MDLKGGEEMVASELLELLELVVDLTLASELLELLELVVDLTLAFELLEPIELAVKSNVIKLNIFSWIDSGKKSNKFNTLQRRSIRANAIILYSGTLFLDFEIGVAIRSRAVRRRVSPPVSHFNVESPWVLNAMV